ncbi:MAG TPA: protease inhibitor I42 family protein [Chthoniobacterales bacterium]|nr:protease inhibitor I42 family protein [Chthoniobacterales bacterium]
MVRIRSVADFVFDQEDNGALVHVPRGSKVTIELPENPTTGHQWAVDSIDELFLAPEGDAFLTGKQMGLGAGGVRRFFFRAKGSGCTSLSLTNKRALQSRAEAAASFKLAVRIVK